MPGRTCLRWLSLSQSYVDQATGGTEVYVHRLNVALARRGAEVTAAHFGAGQDRRQVDGITVATLPRPSMPRTRVDEWTCPPLGLEHFLDLLEEVKPSVVHFHGSFQNHPPEYLEHARRRGAKVLLAYHAPGLTCLQSALLENGRDLCDGRLDPQRCTRCGLTWLGLPGPVAEVFSRVDLHSLAPLFPRALGHPLERLHGMESFQGRVRQGFEAADVIVTHADWVRDLLGRNAIGYAKQVNLPLPPPEGETTAAAVHLWDGLPGGLRLLFVGRLIDIKGFHILVEALTDHLRTEPDLGLLVLGAPGDPAYAQRVRALASADHRVRIDPPRSPVEAMGAMKVADAVVVPSIWPETGPYTVLESQWVGTPVIGTRLGGIAERLSSDPGSLLFARGDARDLARCILSLNREACSPEKKERRSREFRERYLAEFDRSLHALMQRVT